MKELSIEEKAKRYDEAKLRMSAAYNSNRCTIGFMNEIFPELAESEDERIRKVQLDYWRSVGGKEWYGVPVQETIAWLEKQGEQKSAWSEEDKNRINRLIAYFEDKESFTAEDDVVYANWLKSLKDRYTWKPSKEQMERLKGTIDSLPHQEVLYSLYQDLKKLIEE